MIILIISTIIIIVITITSLVSESYIMVYATASDRQQDNAHVENVFWLAACARRGRRGLKREGENSHIFGGARADVHWRRFDTLKKKIKKKKIKELT